MMILLTSNKKTTNHTSDDNSGLDCAARRLAARRLAKSPEGTERATSVNVRLPRPRRDPLAVSISRDIVNFPSELCRRRSGMFAEIARLLPPDCFPPKDERACKICYT